jgi:hypothetical protein
MAVGHAMMDAKVLFCAGGKQPGSSSLAECSAQVALFSENSSRWLVADQAVMTVGAADAVRGASSPAQVGTHASLWIAR